MSVSINSRSKKNVLSQILKARPDLKADYNRKNARLTTSEKQLETAQKKLDKYDPSNLSKSKTHLMLDEIKKIEDNIKKEQDTPTSDSQSKIDRMEQYIERIKHEEELRLSDISELDEMIPLIEQQKAKWSKELEEYKSNLLREFEKNPAKFFPSASSRARGIRKSRRRKSRRRKSRRRKSHRRKSRRRKSRRRKSR